MTTFRMGENNWKQSNQQRINLQNVQVAHEGISLIAQLVKNLPAKKETLVWFLGQEDPLEKGQATHSSIPGLHWWLNW